MGLCVRPSLHLSQANNNIISNNFDRHARCNVSFRGNVFWSDNTNTSKTKQILPLVYAFHSLPSYRWIWLTFNLENVFFFVNLLLGVQETEHTFNDMTNCSNIWCAMCIVWRRRKGLRLSEHASWFILQFPFESPIQKQTFKLNSVNENKQWISFPNYNNIPQILTGVRIMLSSWRQSFNRLKI